MSGPRGKPAQLAGFTLRSGLGGGGFADVFLYTEDQLDREVAVKILRAEHLSDASLRQFEREASIMARTSAHPYIVTIYAAGVAADGRPYIAMEYYPGEHFGVRARGGKLAVAEVLRVGIRVSAAVETAHRAGIVHRDIKPANILTSAYGNPGLTDFGIAGVQREGHVDIAAGVTVAFASPEVLRDEPGAGDERSDIYSLAATLYTLIAGRSPFWIPGGDNTDHAVLARAANGEAPALDRPDVPVSLNHLLRYAMAVAADQRPPSALALARALQDIEQELALAPTPIEVLDLGRTTAPSPTRPEPDDDDGDGTRRAMPQVVDPDGDEHRTRARSSLPTSAPVAPGAATRPEPAAHAAAPITAAPAPSDASVPSPWAYGDPVSASPWAVSTATGAPGAVAEHEADPETMARPVPPPPAAETPTGRSRRGPLIAAGVGAVAVLAIGAGLVLRPKDPPLAVVPPAPTTRPTVSIVVPRTPDTPQKVTAVVHPDGNLIVTIAAKSHDTAGTTTIPAGPAIFRLRRTDRNGASWPSGQPLLDATGTLDGSGAAQITVAGLTGQLPCLRVAALGADRMSEESIEVCATAEPAAP